MVTKRCSRPLAGSRTVTARAGGGAWVVFLLAGRGPCFGGPGRRWWFLRWPWPRCDARSLSEPGS